MLSLTSKLDGTILTKIGELPINLAFNRVLKWYEVCEDDSLEQLQKIQKGWQLFVAHELPFETVDDYEIAADTVNDIAIYISEEQYGKQETDDVENGIEPVKWISYSQDSEAIYASFIYDYNIDLIDQQEKLRWEKFRALFNNLSAKSPLMRIVDIRQRSLDGLEGKALSDLIQAQEYYALEGQTADNLNAQFGSMFDMLKAQAEQK